MITRPYLTRPYLTTYTGKRFYWDAIQSNEYSIYDIAHALSQICRYNGHGHGFLSVAEHSVEVSRMVPRRYSLWGLLHDAGEAYVSDLQSGLKHLPQMKAYREIEYRVQSAICDTFGLASLEPPAVKDADRDIVKLEMARLGFFGFSEGRGSPYLNSDKAEQAFLVRFREIMVT